MSDHLNNLLPEESLLLSLCRLKFNDLNKQEINEYLLQVTDWDYFSRLANEHGIIGLIWNNLTETGNSSTIPARYLERLHSGYFKSLARNAFLFSQLEEIVSLAEKDSIKLILLKGLALEKTVYGNKGLRQMTDIDILVKQEDAIRMRKILLKNGYESAPLISHVFEKKIFRHGKHLPEMYKKGLSVEIHFKLFGAQEKRIGEEFINKSYQISEESKALYPDQQLHFLYLVKHLDKHEKEGTSQLRLYADLVVLLQNYFDRIVCRELFEYASEAGLEGAIAEKFIILEEYLGISFQEWITSFTGKTNSDAIKEKFIRFLRHPADNQPRAEKGSLFNPVKEIHGLFNKSLFITGFLFPSLAYLKYNYKVKSKTIAALYYPVWWVRLGRMLIKGRV